MVTAAVILASRCKAAEVWTCNEQGTPPQQCPQQCARGGSVASVFHSAGCPGEPGMMAHAPRMQVGATQAHLPVLPPLPQPQI